MPTLYRVYRPQRFAELVGQDHVTQTLRRAIEQQKTSHAYLFHGPRGTGKTSTARILAKRLNCRRAADAEPCNQCELCQASQAGKNIDVIEIDAASNRGIDDIRSLRSAVGLVPAMSQHKIYIIDEVHMLTGEAFSALLKTLEEPVAHAVFILATTELHKVPATIVSRCQLYRFKRASHEELKQRLTHLLKQEKRQADEAALDFIISRSDGCYRDAESLLGQLLTLPETTITRSAVTELLGLPPADLIEKFVAALAANDASTALNAVNQAYTGGHDPDQLLREAISLARDQALAAAQTGASPAAQPAIVRALLQARQDLAYVPQPLIALQLAVLTICGKNNVGATFMAPKKEDSINQTPTSTSQAPAADLPNHALAKAWPDLIQAVKPLNPVAATFLRATRPGELTDGVLTIHMQYGLHRNFFEKPDNKKLVEEQLSKLLQTVVTIRCHVDEAAVTPALSLATDQARQEDDLLQTVKEVFGK